MLTQLQRARWAKELDELADKLDTGRGLVVSSGYTDAHQALAVALKNYKESLVELADTEEPTETDILRLKEQAQKLQKCAIAYIEEKKKQKNPYSLYGDPRKGIRKATGDKRVRLEAAAALSVFSAKCLSILPADQLQSTKSAPPIVRSISLHEMTNLHGVKSATEKASEARARELRMDALEATSTFKSASEEITQKKGFHFNEAKEYLGLLGRVHRDECLSFGNEKEFLEKYRENRLSIRKIVAVYHSMKWAKEKAQESAEIKRQYEKLKLLTGISDSQFEKLSGKVTTLEMIGEYMDLRAGVLANPEYSRLKEEDRRKLFSLSYDEANTKMIEYYNAEDPAKQDRYRLYLAIRDMKRYEQIGIKPQVEQELELEASGFEKSLEKNGQTKSIKLATAKAGTESPMAVYNPEEGVAISLPGFAKAKVGKISHGLQRGIFGGSYHVGLLGAKAEGAIRIGFSAGNPLESSLSVEAGASAYGVRGVAKSKLGKNNYHLLGRAEGEIGFAEVRGGLQLGTTAHTTKDGKKSTSFGIKAEGTAITGVFKGAIGGGFSLFGVRIAWRLEGRAIAVGAEAKAELSTGRVSFGLGAALGLGGGFEVSLDWSGLKEKFTNWKKRKQISKEALRLKQAQHTNTVKPKKVEIEMITLKPMGP